MRGKGRRGLKMGLGVLLALLALACLAYARWHSGQPFIGYETYAASTQGALSVSTGYTLYALARVAVAPLVVAAAVLAALAVRDRSREAGKKHEGEE